MKGRSVADIVKIPLLKKADLDAAVGVFFDGFSKVVVALSVLVGTIGLGFETVVGTMMPGLLVSVVFLNGGMWLYYRHMARLRGEPGLTAIPAGLQSNRMFIWLFSIMLPVYQATGDALLAYKVGVLAHFLGGIVFIIGAFVVPALMRVVPAAALFGSLGGGVMAFLILQSMNGVLALPLAGWLALMILFVIYLGRIETKLPAALIAIVVGASIAWAGGSMGTGAVAASFGSLGFHVPRLTLDIFSPDVFGQVASYLPIIIVFSLDEVITGIQGVEQAKECGDTYFTATEPLVISGISSLVGSLCGSPLATGMYWGYPGWKKMGAGTGYHLGVVALYALVCLTGLTAIITVLVPEAVVLPILVFVGVSCYAQAFEVAEPRHYPAVILASLPMVMGFVVDNAAEGALPGFAAFDAGSPFIALLVGCLFVFVIDNAWLKAAATNVVALALTLVGMIHSPGIILSAGYELELSWIVAYTVLAAGFCVLHCVRRERT